MTDQHSKPPIPPSNSSRGTTADWAKSVYIDNFAPLHVQVFTKYCDGWNHHPRAMKVIHLLVLGMVITVLGLIVFSPDRPSRPQPVVTKPEHSSTPVYAPVADARSAGPGKLLPIQVAFRKSHVGKGMVIQIVANAGSPPLSLQLAINRADQTVRKDLVLIPGEQTEVGWLELKHLNFIVQSGQRVTFTAKGYDPFVVKIP